MGVYIWKERLPNAYQEVEYIGRNGNNYIDTGWVPNRASNFEVNIGYKITTTSTRYVVLSQYQAISGGYEESMEINANNKARYYKAKSSPTDFVSSNTLNTSSFNDIIFKSNGTTQSIILNGTTTTGTLSGQVQNLTAYLFIDRSLRWTTFTANSFISYCKIYESGTLVRDFVPCYRKSDNVIGMYDLANNQFYTNSGSGTFTKGQDINYVEHELKNAYIGEVIECDFTQSDCGFTLKQNNEGSYGRDSRGFYVYNGNTSSSSTLGFTGWKIPSSIYSRGNLKKLELFVKRSGGTQSSCGITVNLDGNRFRYIRTGLQARRPSTTTNISVAVGGDTNGVEYKYTVDLENAIMSVSFSNDTLTIPSAQISSFYTDWNAGNTNLTLIGNTGASSAVTVSMSKAIFYF